MHTCTQEPWVRPGNNKLACCTQAGPAQTAGCGGGMDRWQYSSHLLLHALLVASITLLLHQEIPCGCVYRSSQWIGKSTSDLCPCFRHWGVRLSMVSCLQLSSGFWINSWCKTQQNKSQKWFMVNGRSMRDRQTDRQTDEVHVEMTRGSLTLTPTSKVHVELCCCHESKYIKCMKPFWWGLCNSMAKDHVQSMTSPWICMVYWISHSYGGKR